MLLGLPSTFPPRGAHVHGSWCPLSGHDSSVATLSFWKQHPEMGARNINDLGASTLLLSVMCDRAASHQFDVVWACRETLSEAGMFPLPRFTSALAEHDEEPAHALPLAL